MAEAAEFDFSSLSVQEDELPKRAGGRTKTIKDNPFVKWVGDSNSDGKGRAVTIPKSQLKQTERLIRDAARELGLGVRVVTSLKGEALEKAANNKNIKVQFQAQPKKKYAPRKRQGENWDGAVTAPSA